MTGRSFAGRVGLMMAGAPIRQQIETARHADSAGLHSLWSGDGGDAFGPLLVYAVNTERIRIGTAVAVWHRPPIVTASAALQLSAASNGRFALGLGAGPRQWNEDWYGIAFDKPIGRMREYVRAIKGAFESGPQAPFSFAGDHFTISRYRRLNPAAAPQILLGTVGPQMNRLAGAIADGVLFDVLLPKKYVCDIALPAFQRGLDHAGRLRGSDGVGAMVCCVADPDEQTALNGVKWGLLGHLVAEYFYPVWGASGFEIETRRAQQRYVSGDSAGAVAELSDDFARSVAIAGTPDDVRRQIADWLQIVDFIALWAPHRAEAPHASTLDYLIDVVT